MTGRSGTVLFAVRSVRAAVVGALATGVLTPGASGQSLNIRYGTTATTPSSSYAAAGLAGVWNSFLVTPGYATQPLVGLQGTPVAAQYYQYGNSTMLSYNNPLTSGDDKKLMDSMMLSTNNPVDGCFWVQGLMPGNYEVTIYAMTPDDPTRQCRVRVDNGSPGPMMLGGAWPGHQQSGVTYARFTVLTTDGTIAFHDGLYGGVLQSGMNGVQFRFLDACATAAVTTQPSSVAVCRGVAAGFTVNATSTTTVAYRWQAEASPLRSNVWSDLADGPIPGVSATASNTGTHLLTVSGTQAASSVRLRCRVSNACGVVNSTAAALYVDPADLGSQGGVAGRDGAHDNNDFIVFINKFFSQDPAADVGKQGGVLGFDGQYDNNDFIAFIDQFFAAC